MTFALSITFATMFAAGCYLLLKPDFVKILGGIILISNAANFFIMSAGLSRGEEPIYPLEANETVSDPLVQAMTLTAIVISFGISALMIALIYRVYMSHRSVDVELIADREERAVQIEEQERIEEQIEAMPDREEIDAEPVADVAR